MLQTELKAAVNDQFPRTLGMLREAISAFPAGEWRVGDLDYLRPAGVAYHALETIDFYTGEKPPDKFPWGGRFGIDWEEADSAKLPSQDQVLAYLDEMEAKVQVWLEDCDLMSQERLFPYTGPNVLGRAMYILRHTQHHLAEMGLELTRRGYVGPDWK